MPVTSASSTASSYTMLTHSGYTTMYRSTWAVKDIPGRTVFHDGDAALFPTVTAFVAPNGNAGVFLAVRQGRDNAAQLGTNERVALTQAHAHDAGSRVMTGYTQTTEQVAGHTYVVGAVTVAPPRTATSPSDRVSEFVYATSLGGRTFYVLVGASSKASRQDGQDADMIVGATRAR